MYKYSGLSRHLHQSPPPPDHSQLNNPNYSRPSYPDPHTDHPDTIQIQWYTLPVRYNQFHLQRWHISYYKEHLNQARTSFRPVEIAGRKSSYRKDDTLLHVDSFPSTPVKGKRIMRFFTNINPDKPRVWRLGEPFPQVVQKFGDQLRKPIPGLAWFLNAVGITKDYRTLYDHYMTCMHDKMKGDKEYQRNVTQYEILFPPGSTWIVYTDQASHAAMAGQHVLEQTYYLPVKGLHNPETSPLRILERFYGEKLV